MLSGELRWTGWQKVRALLAATVVGLVLTMATDVLWPAFLAWMIEQGTASAYTAPFDRVAAWAWIYLIFGFPVAFICCLLFGSLALNKAEHDGRTSYRDAALLGARTGLIFAAIVTGLVLLNGITTVLDDHRSFNSWSFGGQVINDGMPTLLGWLYQSFDIVVTVVVGAIAGLAARTAAGPPRGRRAAAATAPTPSGIRDPDRRSPPERS